MKAIIYITLALSLCPLLVQSKSIERDDARGIAEMFFANQIHTKSASDGEITQIDFCGTRFESLEDSSVNNQIFIYNKDNQGAVIISTNDNTPAILGYTDSPITNSDDLPIGFIEILSNYQLQIDAYQNQTTEKSASLNSNWDQSEILTVSGATFPLLTTHWAQNNTYSSHCPYDEEKETNTLAGCVATAMAQILKYHNYPAQAVGFNSYYHIGNNNTFGDLAVDYAGSTYNWANMPDELDITSNESQIEDVSRLIYHCGVAVGMDFDPEYSGAWITEAMTSSQMSAEFALKSFFNYDPEKLIAVSKTNYSDDAWEALLKNEIDQKRPVLFAGEKDNAGGHAFVIDGYNANGLFHINWGWSGNADGYYAITALNPLNTGAYNTNQRALIGIQPNVDIDIYSVKLDSTIQYTINDNKLVVGASITNNSDAQFSGQVCGVLFDDESRIIDYLTCDELDIQLTSGGKRQISVSTEIDNPMLRGYYSFGLYYKSDLMGWRAAIDPEGECNTDINLSPGSGGTSILCVNDSVMLSTNTIITGESISISTKIRNRSENDYDGIIAAAIYTYNGTLVKDFGTVLQKNFKAGEDEVLELNTTDINAPEGEYQLVLLQKYKNSFSKSILSSNGYNNPQTIRVVNESVMEDAYENNDCIRDAYQIVPTFTDNTFEFVTSTTQIHVSTDEDYFYIELPMGYTYSISGRVNDKYSNESDQDYTCDVIWSHSIGNQWSLVYDDKIFTNYETTNGGRIYFGVLPYSGQITGTYSLDLTFEREPLSAIGDAPGIEEATITSEIAVFPNPVADLLSITSPEEIIDYELINQVGHSFGHVLVNSCNFNVEMSNYTPGLYLLKLNNGSLIETKQISVR